MNNFHMNPNNAVVNGASTQTQAIKKAAKMLRNSNADHVFYGKHEDYKEAQYLKNPYPSSDRELQNIAKRNPNATIFALHRGNSAHENL